MNPRMSFLTGEKVKTVELENNWSHMELLENGNSRMSTLPIEVYSHLYPAKKAKGKILIGGLGLGLILRLMNQFQSKVESITIIENAKEVIDMIGPHIQFFKDTKIVNYDIKKFLEQTDEVFNFIYLDTWSSTGVIEFYDTVLPLRKLAEKKTCKKENVICWMEEVMRGQIVSELLVAKKTNTLLSIYETCKNSEEFQKKWRLIPYEFIKKYGLPSLLKLNMKKYANLVFNFVSKY